MAAIPRSQPFAKQACPLATCDGSGWILGPEDVARPCECRAQRRTEAADVLHGLRIVDGEPATDVESIERPQLLPARGGHQLRTGLQGLHVLGGVHRL